MVNYRKSKVAALIAIVLASVTFSCLYIKYSIRDKRTFYSRHGFEVNAEDGIKLSPSEIDKAIDITVFVLENSKIFSKREIDESLSYASRYSIFVLDHQFKCKGNGLRCLGEFGTTPLKNGAIAFEYTPNLADSAFGHELLHYFNYHITGSVDEYHKQEALFRFGCTWKFPPSDNESPNRKILRAECESASAEVTIARRLGK